MLLHVKHLRRLALCAAILASTALYACADRIASTGSPRFTVDIPAGWQHEERTVKMNQQIAMHSSDGSRAMIILAVNAPGIDKQKAMMAMLQLLQKDVFGGSTVVSPPHPQAFGSHPGMESDVKLNVKGKVANGLSGSFFIGDMIFGIAGVCGPGDSAAFGTYRGVAGSISMGGAVATNNSPKTPPKEPAPSPSSTRFRDKLKGAFLHILHKIPIFKPKE